MSYFNAGRHRTIQLAEYLSKKGWKRRTSLGVIRYKHPDGDTAPNMEAARSIQIKKDSTPKPHDVRAD